jgi:formylglycine-generating enzyme
MPDNCCAPGRSDSEVNREERRIVVPRGLPPSTLVSVPGGRYSMGDESEWSYAGDGEGPVHPIELSAFRIDRYAVTNAQFGAFVNDTGWRTDAESYGWSFVFGGLLPDDFPPTRAVQAAPWWRQVEGADWRHPEGPQSDVADRLDHPVVHVSWNDALAYCSWSGTRLPSEAEWEVAARGGLAGQPFPWGDQPEPDGIPRMNTFQGEFPGGGTADHRGTTSVHAFEPNGYGLYNSTGNGWEWCADWLDVDFYAKSPVVQPRGPAVGLFKVQRGGSYLCHASYCRRYRVSSRFGSAPDSSTGNVGFRIVLNT